MTRTAAELAVERDRLLESGRTEAEVEAMQLAASLTPWQVRCVAVYLSSKRAAHALRRINVWDALHERLGFDLANTIDELHEEAIENDEFRAAQRRAAQPRRPEDPCIGRDRHEWYIGRGGGEVCRRCGARSRVQPLSRRESETGASAPRPACQHEHVEVRDNKHGRAGWWCSDCHMGFP